MAGSNLSLVESCHACLNSADDVNVLVRLGLIGGSGLEELFEGKSLNIETKYGKISTVIIGEISGQEVAFVPRHGSKHEIPPHRVNYRAIIAGLRDLAVDRIIATNAVGAINESYHLGDIVIPIDVLDFTKGRVGTFFDSEPVTHVDVTEPYCSDLRDCLIQSAEGHCRVWKESIMACTEGPRFETPAEIRMLRQLGSDVVGMTGVPEVFLAREAGLCYASLSFVSNMAAGIQRQVTQDEVLKIAERTKPIISTILLNAAGRIRDSKSCRCNPARDSEV